MIDILMRSSSGNFILTKEGGLTINDSPWTGLGTRNPNPTNTYIVKVKLNEGKHPKFDGSPAQYKYIDTYIYSGMKTNSYTPAEIEEYIELLQEAIDFSKKVNQFIEQSDEWRE